MTTADPTIQADEETEELLLAILAQLDQGNLNLPLLPHVASQVLTLIGDPDTNAATLSHLIQQDPVLAAHILRIANSPAYLPRTPIESLQQAIAWVGLNLLAGTAFSLSVQANVFNINGYEQEVKGLWQHSLAAGLYGKAIAGRLGHNVENAFLCGLLHMLGKHFVIHTVNQYRQGVNAPLPKTTMQKLMKESYIEVGMQLANGWKLPPPVKEAIVLHQDHAYHLSTSPMMGTPITCLASHLASHLLDPSSIDKESLLTLSVIQTLKISPEDMEALGEMEEAIRDSIETMLV